MQFHFLGYTYNSPLDALFFLSILWGVPLLLSILFITSVTQFLRGKDSFFSHLGRKAILAGIVLTLAIIMVGWKAGWDWTVYGGVASSKYFYPLLSLPLIISLASALTARDKRFATGFLTAWLSFIYLVFFSLPFAAYALISGTILYLPNMVNFLAVFSGFILGYPWLVAIYLYIAIVSAIGSAIGHYSLKRVDGQRDVGLEERFFATTGVDPSAKRKYRDRLLVFLPLFFIPILIVIGSVQASVEKTRFDRLAASVTIENIREEIVRDSSGKKVLQITSEITVPDEGEYYTYISETPHGGRSLIYQAIANNGKRGYNVTYFVPGKNNLVVEYVPRNPDIGASYTIRLNVGATGGSYVRGGEILEKAYTTKTYFPEDFR